MIRAILAFLAMTAALCLAGAALAQDPDLSPPRTMAIAKAQEGVFCGYEESESGDNPDYVSILMDGNVYDFYAGVSREEYDLLAQMPLGTPVLFNFSVINYYSEPGGGRFTDPFIVAVKVNGQPKMALCPR
ncbi:MAG: hypothetical protein LBL95_05825 [Deltaproteobacteria bacterium]|jgi:hypothetical protein|nr:hypothetical protein [Deltaproteobacteria bacterium]